MSRFNDNPEYDDDIPEENLEIPDEWYAEDIKNIDDPELRAKEIEEAEKIRDWEQELNEKLDAGEISHHEHWAEYEFEIRPAKIKFSTRAALESEGITYDMLGDISEDWDLITADNQRLMCLKEDLEKRIDLMGPEASQELADRMLEEERLSKEAHEMISRQVRLHRK